MRRVGLAAVIVIVVVGSSCSPRVSEVRTNSGGTLDCRSDTVLYAAIDPVPEAAVPSPADALALLGDDLVPPGTPEMESESSAEIAFVYRDSDGRRLGRVIVERQGGSGWLPTRTERCG